MRTMTAKDARYDFCRLIDHMRAGHQTRTTRPGREVNGGIRAAEDSRRIVGGTKGD